MRHIFVINPAAGPRDQTDSLRLLIEKSARETNISPEYFITEYPGHAREVVGALLRKSGGETLRFYACGGDGTLNETVSGAFGSDNAQITHFPCGTGNDFVRLFGKNSSQITLPRLICGTPVPFDLIRCGDACSLNICSAGIDARVAAGISKFKRLPFMRGMMPYAASIVEQFFHPLGDAYRLTVDGVCYDGEYSLVLFANGQYYGGGFHPMPEADPTDGLMDILLVRPLSRLTAASVLSKYQKGKFRELPQYVRPLKGRHATLEAAGSAPITLNADGEIFTPKSIEIKIVNKGLTFVIPEGFALENEKSKVYQ